MYILKDIIKNMDIERNGYSYYIERLSTLENRNQLLERTNFVIKCIEDKEMTYQDAIILSKIFHYIKFHGCKYNNSIISKVNSIML